MDSSSDLVKFAILQDTSFLFLFAFVIVGVILLIVSFAFDFNMSFYEKRISPIYAAIESGKTILSEFHG